MTFIGQTNEPFETGLYIAFAAISGVLFFIQIYFLQKLRMLPVYILPALSACICFENGLLAGGGRSDPSWRISQFVTAIQALIIPFNVIIIFEMPFRLHQARTAHFLCIPFEQGALISGLIAKLSLWAVRIFALGLLVINIIVNFKIPHAASNIAGEVGFVYFSEVDDKIHVWLGLLPPLILSVEAIILSIVMQRFDLSLFSSNSPPRYAKDFSLGVRNQNYYWRYLLPISLIYAVTHIFGRRLYPVLSNAGDVCLLIGESLMTHRVQLDLAVAGSFADFLHRSNVVFRSSLSTHPPSHTTTTTTHRGSHHKDPHRKPSVTEKGDYSLVIAQQQPQEVALNGNDIEMNSLGHASGEEGSHPQNAATREPFAMEAPSQEVIQRDQDLEAAHNGNGNGDGGGNAAEDEGAAVEDSDVQISFSNTYQEVAPHEKLEMGENVERLNELSPYQRSKVGRVSFESLKEN
jgi:hypothetical protein